MRKIKFDRDCLAYLMEPLSVGDIIEVTDMHGKKYTLMVCIDEANSTSCKSCVFNTNGGPVCESTISAPFVERIMDLSPCNALLLNDGKYYKFQHCVYYKNLDSVLEGL